MVALMSYDKPTRSNELKSRHTNSHTHTAHTQRKTWLCVRVWVFVVGKGRFVPNIDLF
jgi:hypothetical protein